MHSSWPPHFTQHCICIDGDWCHHRSSGIYRLPRFFPKMNKASVIAFDLPSHLFSMSVIISFQESSTNGSVTNSPLVTRRFIQDVVLVTVCSFLLLGSVLFAWCTTVSLTTHLSEDICGVSVLWCLWNQLLDSCTPEVSYEHVLHPFPRLWPWSNVTSTVRPIDQGLWWPLSLQAWPCPLETQTSPDCAQEDERDWVESSQWFSFLFCKPTAPWAPRGRYLSPAPCPWTRLICPPCPWAVGRSPLEEEAGVAGQFGVHFQCSSSLSGKH